MTKYEEFLKAMEDAGGMKRPPRDPNRIDGVLEAIKRLWQKFPDWRLGQLIANMTKMGDPYFLEDGELLRRIDDYEKKIAGEGSK